MSRTQDWFQTFEFNLVVVVWPVDPQKEREIEVSTYPDCYTNLPKSIFLCVPDRKLPIIKRLVSF